MSSQNENQNPEPETDSVRGYGGGGVDAVTSVDEVTRRVAEMAESVSLSDLDQLCEGDPYVSIDSLNAGYGKMQILHNFNLRVGRRQSLCLIGPNGAGKSTILHSIFGFTRIFSGQITIGDERRDVTSMTPSQ